MKYIARKPFRYGTGVFMTGQQVSVKPDDVRMLQSQGKIGGPVREAAIFRPVENAMQPKAEPKVFELPETMPPARELKKPPEEMTKNELVRELNIRGIEHNKRQIKSQLIDLLRGD